MEESKQVLVNEDEEKVVKVTDYLYSDLKFQVIRFILVSFVITIIFLNAKYGFLIAKNRGDCLFDWFLESTSNFNIFFANNLKYRDILLIASSLCIDIVILMYGYFWCINGKSWRSTLTLSLFYSFRMITQFIFQMKYPNGYLWAYPGFPSLVVPYLKTNDFFFSGHVGLPIIAGLEFKEQKLLGMFYFCLFSSFFELVTMIILRGHYTIDLIAGLIFAHYSHLIADKYKYILDDSCLGMKEELEETNIESKENKV